jgi:two-component system, OmpR family, response regulator
MDSEGPERILIVEDEEPIRSLLADVLRAEGYSIVEAVNGLDALRALGQERPDAIVLDVMMPMMDGPTFARACHAQSPMRPIPILLVSASPKLWQTAECLRRYGVRGFVAKPFDLNILVDAVAGLAEPARVLAIVS